MEPELELRLTLAEIAAVTAALVIAAEGMRAAHARIAAQAQAQMGKADPDE